MLGPYLLRMAPLHFKAQNLIQLQRLQMLLVTYLAQAQHLYLQLRTRLIMLAPILRDFTGRVPLLQTH